MALELWFHDTFDEGMDTAIASHAANTGQGWVDQDDWVQNPGPGATVRGGQGYANIPANDDSAVHRISIAPHNFDYDIVAQFRSTNVTNLGSIIGICFRGALTGTKGHYNCELSGSSTRLRFQKVENGIGSPIDEVSVSGDWTVNTIHTLKVEVRGSEFKAYLDGVLKLTVNDSTWSGSGSHNYIGFRLTSNSVTAGEQRIYDFKVYADSPDTKKISLNETLKLNETLELNEPCEQQEPLSGKTVLDNFTGPDNQTLAGHVSDSGHAYAEGHAFASHPFFGLGLKPMILNGNGMLSTPAGSRLRDTRQLVFTPRINSYEIGCCFRKSSVSKPTNYLFFYWRDTTSAPSRTGSGTRATTRVSGKRYELFLGNGGYAQLQRRIGNTVTVLDTTTGAFGTDSNNFLQIIQDGSDITININGVPVLTATDAAITEVGTISLNVTSQSSATPFAKGYWRLNWLYVDDTYATFPIANKELVFTERLTAKENFTLEKPDYDTGHFVNIPDAAAFLEAIEPPTIEEPTTKSIDSSDAVSAVDVVSILKNSGCWYNASWTYRKLITISNSMVSGSSNLTDFQCLIDITDTDILANAQADGDDILFTANDGTTQLKHDLVAYDSSTGRVRAYVKIPTLAFASNTTIYVYFGNAGASAQEDEANTWTNYHAVFHCEEDPSGAAPQVTDSSGNGNNGTTEGTMTSGDLVTGKVAKGLDLDGSNDAWQCASLNPTAGNFTKSLWAKSHAFDPVNTINQEMTHQADGSGTGRDALSFALDGGTSSPNKRYKLQTALGGTAMQGSTQFGPSDNDVLYRFSVTYDGTTVRIYKNGVQENSAARTMESATGNLIFGKTKASANFFNGVLDEVFIYKGTRSADWLVTEYNNQNSPGTYLSVGSLQDPTICNTLFIGIAETLLALDIPELSGDRGIELLETAHINELPGVSGNQINKILTIAEFMSADDTPLSSMEIELSDSFEASEVISRIFEFLEFAQHGETLSLSALLSVIDTGNINDQIAVRLLLSLEDTVNISEVIQRILALNENATLTDLINTMRALPGTQDTARAADRIQITRSSVAEFLPPEKTYHARELKTLFYVEKRKKIN